MFTWEECCTGWVEKSANIKSCCWLEGGAAVGGAWEAGNELKSAKGSNWGGFGWTLEKSPKSANPVATLLPLKRIKK